MAAKKKAKKAPAKKAKKAGKRKPNAAFMKPVQPDAVLGAVVGSSPMPRTELTKEALSGPTSRRTACRTRRTAATSTPTTS